MSPPPVATTSDNRLRNYPTAWSTTPSILINLLRAGLQDFIQVLNVSSATTTVNKLLGVLPRSNNLPGLSLGYSAATFLVPQILAHEDALVHGRVFIFKSTALAMTSHGMLITGKYLNAHFVSVFLFVCMRYEC